MHADIIQENNLTHTKQPKHSEWTQWDEAKSSNKDTALSADSNRVLSTLKHY